MIVHLNAVLTAEELANVRASLGKADWSDGKQTAGYAAKLVKSNEQATGPEVQEARHIIHDALFRNELFASAAIPKRHSKIMFNRYRTDEVYGLHVDSPVMGDFPDQLRSDLSVTLFLSDPESYEGGELVISPMGVERSIKLAAGDAVLYPTSSLHRVTPVTSGERVAAILWVQSLVRDVSERQILFDLSAAAQQVFKRAGKTPVYDLIDNSHANLLRKWSDC